MINKKVDDNDDGIVVYEVDDVIDEDSKVETITKIIDKVDDVGKIVSVFFFSNQLCRVRKIH